MLTDHELLLIVSVRRFHLLERCVVRRDVLLKVLSRKLAGCERDLFPRKRAGHALPESKSDSLVRLVSLGV